MSNIATHSHGEHSGSRSPTSRSCSRRCWSITTSLSSAAAALTLALALAGCSERPGFKNTDITGASYAKGFTLTDHNGAQRALADYKGKVTTVFFGFAQCPDVCPTTLAEMKSVLDTLGPARKDVQVLFVTVDPERDSPALLKEYVTAFDPSFVGLTGSPAEIAAVAKEFKVFYEKVPGKTDPAKYTINHTAGTFVFDRQGRLRLFVTHGRGPENLIGDIKLLLAQ